MVVLVLSVHFDGMSLGVEGTNCWATVHDLTLMGANGTSLLWQNLKCLSLGLEREVPNILSITKKKWYDYDGLNVLLANQNKHVGNVDSDRAAVHEAMDNVLNDVHVFGKSVHDYAVWSHIEEEIYWCVQNALEHIVVHLCKSLVDKLSHNVFFEDLAQSLE